VGQGDWKDTTLVAKEVRVKFELRLKAEPTLPANKPAPTKATSG
jgi:hypothetical protein